MYLRTSKVTEGGEVVIPAEFLDKMELSVDDQVAFIYKNNRLIVRKLTAGEGQMTFEEYLSYRDVNIKNEVHERIVKLFYGFAGSVTGDSRLYPNLISGLFDIDLSFAEVKTACFNGGV
jgi:Regulators of stationary/sporulation gene expression